MTSSSPTQRAFSTAGCRQFLRICTGLPILLLLGMVLGFNGGCAYQKPVALESPWLPRQQVWAVAPLANESGVSSVDRLAMTDALILEVSSIKGIDVLPLNRTLEAMLALQIGMDGIPTRAEYEVLRSVLGADRILIGSLIAYDPYRPLRLGASIQLLAPGQSTGLAVDARSLTMAVGHGSPEPTTAPALQRNVQASGIFDADNHGVLLGLEAYSGRRSTHDLARSTTGLYSLDMDLYAEFVFHELLQRLLRVVPGAPPADSAVAIGGS